MKEPTPEARALAVLVLKRQRVVGVLRENFIFTGGVRDRVRRSAVTAVVAAALKKNHDNIDLIRYVQDTMIGLGCQVVRRYGAYYYRGVRAIGETTEPSESAGG